MARHNDTPDIPHSRGDRCIGIPLSTRIALAAVALVVILGFGLTQLLVRQERAALLAENAAHLADAARLNGTRLKKAVDELRRDVIFLSRVPPAPGLVRARANRGVDPASGLSAAHWQERLAGIFAAYTETHSDYFRVDLVGVAGGGHTILGAERRDERIDIVAGEDSRHGGDLALVRAAGELRTGEVGLSEIGLYRDAGGIAVPHRPMLRAATPIAGPDGRTYAMLVVHMDVRLMFDNLGSQLLSGTQAFLFNSEGDYLLHPDAGRAFGFELGRRHRWQDDLPGLRLQAGPAMSSRPEVHLLAAPSGALQAVAERVHFDPLQPERYLTLMYALPEDALAQRLARTRETIALAVATNAGLFLLLLLWLVRRTFAPLDALTRAAHDIAQGRYDATIPAGGRGELGALAAAFRTMQTGVAEREARLRAIAGTSADGFWTVDMAGRILDVNDAYMRMSGYSRDELLRMRLGDIDAIEAPQDIRARIDKIVADGHDLFETEHRRKDGTSWPVEVTASYWPIEGGRMFAFKLDVTEQRQAQLALRRSEEALERAQAMAHIGRWTADVASHVSAISAEIMQILDWPQPAIGWREMAALIHPDDRSTVRAAWHGILGGQPYDIEYRIVRDGRIKWLRVTAELTFDAAGRPLQAVGMLQDVTVVRESELAMETYRERLEKQVKQRTADLAKARARTQLILDSSADGLFGMDMHGRFTFVNPAACAMLGYAQEQLVGKPVHATIHHSRADGTTYPGGACPMLKSLKSGSVMRCDDEVFWRADGQPLAVAYATRPMVENDKTVGTVASFSDITARKAAERELETARSRLQTILDNMPAMIAYWDAGTRNVFGNQAFLDFFGRTADAMRGRPIREVVGEAIFHAYRPHLDGVLAGQPQQFEVKAADPAGRPRHAQAIFIPDGDEGSVKGFFAFVMDITKLKEAEETAALASRVKSDFVANMSHEIRTPLNAVLGLAQVGARMHAERRTHDTFLRILDAGQLLLGSINEILDFSKIEAGKLELERLCFDLGDVVDQAVKTTAVRAYAKGLEFRVEEAPGLATTWIGDPLRLAQILINLLANAIKFTDHGGIVLAVRREKAQLAFRIADTGVGMSAKQIARLFSPFEQADGSTTRRFGGTGLGLAICKRLIDLMGGSIDVDSRPGMGTAFEVLLPLAAADEAPPPVEGSVVLAGLPAAEGQALAATLTGRGVEVAVLPAAAVAPPADLLVMACDPLDATRMATIAAAAAGRRLAIVCTPGTCAHYAPGICEHAALAAADCTIVERPLRAQHVLAALLGRHGAETAGRHTGPRLTGLRVLAAEDNETNRLVLEEILAQEGARLHCAEDGGAALARLMEDGAAAYDIVLTDVQMPGIDGYEIAKRVKALAPALPVIGLTAHAMPEERERCLAAGMVEHVAKPIDVDVLVAAILRHTGARAAVVPAGERAIERGGEHVDWLGLAARFHDRTAFLQKLAVTVLASHKDSPAALLEVAARRDFAALAALAHALKGMCGSLMAWPAHELAAAVEAAARHQQAAAIPLTEQLARTLEETLAEVAAYAARNGDKADAQTP